MQDRKCLCAACPAVVLRLKLIQVSDVREVDINLLLGLLLVAFCALVDNDFVNEGVHKVAIATCRHMWYTTVKKKFFLGGESNGVCL